jgi:hypothetical protein
MKEFSISIRSVEEVQAFVNLAMVQPFDVFVQSERRQVSGKNFMGMFSLDFHQPVHVLVDCDEDNFCRFRQEATELLAS